MKKEKIVVGIMVLCLIVIVSSVTFAYFKARIKGEGANLEVIIGETNLLIERSEITINSIIPILDSTKDEKAEEMVYNEIIYK